MTDEIEPVPSFDQGLLSPVTVGHDEAVSDSMIALRLIMAESALTSAWVKLGIAPPEAIEAFVRELLPAIDERDGVMNVPSALADFDVAGLIGGSVSGGNPVIPLVEMLRSVLPEGARPWVHLGATSQDIMDTALMLTGLDAGRLILEGLGELQDLLTAFSQEHRDLVAAARTLTQQAVPTTVGARASMWTRGVERATIRLSDQLLELPAQLGGAGGTLASFVEIGGQEAALALPSVFAEVTGLAEPEAPWHTSRWPVTELGDAIVQVIDALGKLAADVATLSRTEVGELAEGVGGGSSAMPQKRNPTAAVLIRSAAIRAPHLGATLHTAAALAVDERPDGSWHAEWPVLRELLRLALGATANAVKLVAGLRVDRDAIRRNLKLTGGAILAERLNLVLGEYIGSARVKEIVSEIAGGADLGAILRAEPALDGIDGSDVDVDQLLDPAQYTGLAGDLVDRLDASYFYADEDEGVGDRVIDDGINSPGDIDSAIESDADTTGVDGTESDTTEADATDADTTESDRTEADTIDPNTIDPDTTDPNSIDRNTIDPNTEEPTT